MLNETRNLSTGNLQRIMIDVLYTEGEAQDDAVIVEGIVNNYGFHPQRLESYREEVREMLEQLPDDFRMSSGGGWSFLNLCMDKHGTQWTSFHKTQEELCCLAIGLKLGKWVLPREMWVVLPGGMPYFVYLDKE